MSKVYQEQTEQKNNKEAEKPINQLLAPTSYVRDKAMGANTLPPENKTTYLDPVKVEQIKQATQASQLNEVALLDAKKAYDSLSAEDKTNFTTHEPESLATLQIFGEYVSFLPKLRKLLFSGSMEVFNHLKSKEAIEAYHILDSFPASFVDLFYREHPYLAEGLSRNLPASFLKLKKASFQKGIAKADESKVLSLFQTELQNPTSTTINIVLNILTEAGLENKAKDIYKHLALIQKLAPAHKPLVEAYFDNLAQEENDNNATEKVEKGIVKKGEEYSLIGVGFRFLNKRKTGDHKGTVRFLASNKRTTGIVGLDSIQEKMAGSIGGATFEKQDKQNAKPTSSENQVAQTDLKKWLKDKHIADHPFAEKVEKLTYGDLAYDVDPKAGKAYVLGGKLPLTAINYLSSDFAFRTEQSLIQNIFANITWDATKTKDELLSIQVQAKLGDLVFNNLRMILPEETYGIGKLALHDLNLNFSQVVGKAADFKTYNILFRLIEVLQTLPTAIIGMIQTVVERFSAPDKNQSSQDLAKSLGADLFQNMDLSMDMSQLTIENFISTSKGKIDKIELGKGKEGDISLGIKSNQTDPTGQEALYGKKAALKAKREDLSNSMAKADKDRIIKSLKEKHATKISAQKQEIQTLEQEILTAEQDSAYQLDFKTNNLAITGGSLIQTQVQQSLQAQLAKFGIEGLAGLDIVALTEGIQMHTLVSPKSVDNTSIIIPNITLPQITASKFNNHGISGENVVLETPQLIGITLNMHNHAAGVKEENMLKSIAVTGIKIPQVKFQNLKIRDQKGNLLVHRITPTTLQNIQLNQLDIQEGNFNAHDAFLSLIPESKETYKLEGYTAFGEVSLGQTDVSYQSSKAKAEAQKVDPASITTDTLTVKSNIPQALLASFNYGEKSAATQIHAMGNKLTQVEAEIKVDFNPKTSEGMLERLEITKLVIDDFASTSLQTQFGGKPYTAPKGGKLKGLLIENLVLSKDKITKELAFNPKGMKAELASIEAQAIRLGFMNLQNFSTGKVSAQRMEDNTGYAFDVNKLLGKVENNIHTTNGAHVSLETSIEEEAHLQGTYTDTGKEKGTLQTNLDFPEISLPKIDFKDKKGNYVTSLFKNDTPVKMMGLKAQLSLLANGDIFVKTLHLDKIAADNLEAHVGDFTLNLPKGMPSFIENVALDSLLISSQTGAVQGKAQTGKVHVEQLKTNLKNDFLSWFSFKNTLDAQSIHFDGNSKGDFNLEVEKPQAQLNNKGEDLYHNALTTHKGDIMRLRDVDDKLPFLQADKISMTQSATETQFIVENPILSPLEISGVKTSDKSETVMQVEELKLQGKIKGKLSLTKDAKGTWTMEALDGNILLDEADITIPNLERLTNWMSSNEDKTQKTDKQKQQDLNFMNMLSGYVDVTVYGETVALFVENINGAPCVNLEEFVAKLSDILTDNTVWGADSVFGYLETDDSKNIKTNKKEYILEIDLFKAYGVYVATLLEDINKLVKLDSKEYVKLADLMYAIMYMQRLQKEKTDEEKNENSVENYYMNSAQEAFEEMNPQIKAHLFFDFSKLPVAQRGMLSSLTDEIGSLGFDFNLSFNQTPYNERGEKLEPPFDKHATKPKKGMGMQVSLNDLKMRGLHIQNENLDFRSDLNIQEIQLNQKKAIDKDRRLKAKNILLKNLKVKFKK